MGPGSIAASVNAVFSEHRSLRSSNGHSLNVSAEGNSDLGSETDSDTESVFIYSRVGRLPPTFFRKDEVSNCYIHQKLQIYTTHTGIVHMCLPDNTPIRTVRVHRSSVLDIDADPLGEYVATASIDGTVVIASVEDPQDTVQASFKRPVHAIALHPEYRTVRAYISGGTAGQVLLSERGWLKSRSDTILAQTSSTILALAWNPWGLVWCNEDGITVYDLDTRTVKLQIDRPPQSLRADLYKPRLTLSKTYLVVAWARSVYVVNLPSAKLINRLDLSETIAGVVPFRADELGLPRQFAILTVERSEPELKLIDANTGVENYADELQMNNEGKKLGVNDYHLIVPSNEENWKDLVKLGKPGTKPIERQQTDETEKITEKSQVERRFKKTSTLFGRAREENQNSKQDNKIWIVSCLDVVVARERNVRDHLDWLIERSRYIDAYQAAKSLNTVEDGSYSTLEECRNLGLKAAHQCIDNDNYEKASLILSDVLSPSEDKAEWLMWSNRFFAANKHLIWGDVLPSAELGGDIHDAVLEAAVNARDSSRLSFWIQSWPLSIYDGHILVSKLKNAIETDNSESQSRMMQLVYADLLLKLGEYVRSVQALVQANSSRAFRITSHYHLWNEPHILSILGSILESGQGEMGDGGYVDRLRELIDCRGEISPLKVVNQLKSETNHNMLLFGYLTELSLVDETILAEKPLVDIMIPLYAQYDRAKLLGFLEKFDTYDIDASIDLCRKLNLFNELVYLLGRLDRSKEALDLIVTHLRDYDRAIQFARSRSGDLEIWDQLVGYAGENPGLVLELLKCVEVSPARVLATVTKTMRIPGLKDTLCQVLNGQEVSVALHKGALSIVNTESRHWTQMLRNLRISGIELELDEFVDQLQPQCEGDWQNEPALITEKDNKLMVQRVHKFKGDTSTLSGKLRHLTYIFSRRL